MHRIVCLQVRCLKSKHPVRRSMRPRKTIIRKADDHIIDRIRIRLPIALSLAPSYEVTALLIQYFTLLLRHSPAQQIRFTQREASHPRSDLHNLLLIDDNAIRILQNRLQIRMWIMNLTQPVLRGNIIRNEFHRTWTIKRQDRNDVLELRRLQIT